MKRSEAIKLLSEKLQDMGLESISGGFSSLADETEAEAIIVLLEDIGLLDKAQFGSTCSRCDHKSWDSE